MASSFANFLAQQKPGFGENSKYHHLIVGNPAGDADSIISALALAHVDHLLSLNGSSSSSSAKVPVVSIPRADMTLRRETVLLLEMLNIASETLIYLDDLDDLTEATAAGRTVTLVDHNQLVYPTLLTDEKYDVVEILDHHFDEQAHDLVTGTTRNIAFLNNTALVASTCTLVVERWLNSDSTSMIPPDLAFALLAVILLDAVNMSPAAGKGTVRDETAMTALVQRTDWSSLSRQEHTKEFFTDGELNRTKLYDHLSQSKFDIDFWKALSVTDALRLDYKQFASPGTMFGAASVLLPLADLLSKSNWEAQVLRYMSDCDIPLLVVLSMVIVDDAPQRSLLICGTAEHSTLLVNHLRTDESLQLTAVPMCASEMLTVHQFVQGNAKASRKQVVPIILDYYDKQS